MCDTAGIPHDLLKELWTAYLVSICECIEYIVEGNAFAISAILGEYLPKKVNRAHRYFNKNLRILLARNDYTCEGNNPPHCTLLGLIEMQLTRPFHTVFWFTFTVIQPIVITFSPLLYGHFITLRCNGIICMEHRLHVRNSYYSCLLHIPLHKSGVKSDI